MRERQIGRLCGVFAALLLAMAMLVAACSSSSDSSGKKKSNSTSKDVDEDGGTVTFTNPDNSAVVLELVIPEGALSENTTITVSVASSYPNSPTALPSTVFELGPAGLTFDTPATLNITYDDSELGSITESYLGIHKVVDDAWQHGTFFPVDLDGNIATTTISGFSTWGVVERATVPEIHVFNADVELTNGGTLGYDSVIGGTDDIVLTIANNGDGTLNLEVNDFSIGGTDITSYSIDTSGTASSLPTGDDTPLNTTFNPPADGPAALRSATLTIRSDDPDDDDFVLILSGTGN